MQGGEEEQESRHLFAQRLERGEQRDQRAAIGVHEVHLELHEPVTRFGTC